MTLSTARRRPRAATIAAAAAAAWLASAAPALADPLCTVPANHRYARSLQHYFADLKASFPENGDYSAETALTDANYVAVIAGLKANVGVDGLRLPVVPEFEDSTGYSDLYRRIVAYARSLGLLVYASPLSFGPEEYDGWSDARYAAWLAGYVAVFHPDALSPFNEAGFTDDRMRGILRQLRYRLGGSTVLVGPDRKAVQGGIAELESPYSVAPLFDVIGAHNSGDDASATAENWSRLVADAPGGRPVWSSENPAYWAVGQRAGLPGVIGAVQAGVSALVVWKAKPSLVDDAGQPTPKACKLAQHIFAPAR